VSVGGCSGVSGGSFTLQTSGTFNLKLFLEGYYIGGGQMNSAIFNSGVGVDANEADSIRVEFRDQFTPSTVAYSATVVMGVNGTSTITIPGSLIGGNYYVAVFHRNTVETWSSLPIAISATTSYDFSTSSTQAYDDGVNLPMKEVETGVWAFYSGDVNQDGTVDGLDIGDIDNDASTFAFGYNVTDITGDGASDGLDLGISDNNSQLFLFTAHP
jgi:hypothetical protein